MIDLVFEMIAKSN